MRCLGSDAQAAKRKERGLKMHAEGATPNEISKAIRVTAHTVRRWIREEAAGIERKLLPKGPAPLLTDPQIERLKRELKRGAFAHGYSEDYWTLDRIGHLIWSLFERRYSPSGVWRLMRRIGWSSQRPQRRSLSRDEQEIESWLTHEWPKAKKRTSP
jgi:transposase